MGGHHVLFLSKAQVLGAATEGQLAPETWARKGSVDRDTVLVWPSMKYSWPDRDRDTVNLHDSEFLGASLGQRCCAKDCASRKLMSREDFWVSQSMLSLDIVLGQHKD